MTNEDEEQPPVDPVARSFWFAAARRNANAKRASAQWRVRGNTLELVGVGPRAPLVALTRTSEATQVASASRAWRRVAPNLVVHPLWGDGVALATDGVEVQVDFGDGRATEVALGQLKGPIGPQRVHPLDWDWERNARKVRVFKRKAPLPPAVIPQDTEAAAYWSRHSKLSQEEHEAYVALTRPGVSPEDFERILAALQSARAACVEVARKPKGQRPGLSNQELAALEED